MKILVIELIGFALIAYSIKMLLKSRSINPVATFKFEDASHEFQLEKPGYYSISILGAGFVREVQRAIIKLTLKNDHTLQVGVNKIAPRFSKETRIGIEYWGFLTDDTGRCLITFSNMEHVEAKSSMLRSKRLFESPIDHSKLQIIIHQSTQPFYKLTSIVSLILGTGLVLLGVLTVF